MSDTYIVLHFPNCKRIFAGLIVTLLGFQRSERYFLAEPVLVRAGALSRTTLTAR